jgi:hypothetical protein
MGLPSTSLNKIADYYERTGQKELAEKQRQAADHAASLHNPKTTDKRINELYEKQKSSAGSLPK